MILVIGARKAQVDHIALFQLIIADGFIGHQHAIGCIGQQGQNLRRRSTGEIGVGCRRSPAQSGGVDAVQILQIGPDIGEAVLHRLRSRCAGQVGQIGQMRACGPVGGAKDRDIGPVGQFGIDPGLGIVRGVEDGGRGGKRHGKRRHRNAQRQAAGLQGHRACDDIGQGPGKGGGQEFQGLAIGGDTTPGQADDQQGRTRPEQRGGEEGLVIDRGGGDAFGGQHDLIAGASRLPEQQGRTRQKNQVEPIALPDRRVETLDPAPGRGGGFAAGKAPRRQDNRRKGEAEPGKRCQAKGQSGTAHKGNMTPAEQNGGGQTHGDATKARQHSLSRRQVQDPQRAGPAHPQKGLFAPPTARPCGRNRQGQNPGQNRPRNAEKQEQHRRIQRIAAHRIQPRAKVVGDQRLPGHLSLQIMGLAHDLNIGGIGMAGQGGVVQFDMQLRAGGVGAQGGLRIENPVPSGGGQDQHIVGRSLRRGLRRQANPLKQRVGVGQIDDAGDGDGFGAKTNADDRHSITRADMQVCGGLLGDQDASGRPGQQPHFAGKVGGIARVEGNHFSRASGLVCAACCGGKAVGPGIQNLVQGLDRGGLGNRRPDQAGIGPRHGLDLPVDRHGLGRAFGHRGGTARQKQAKAGEQGHRQGNPRPGPDQAKCAVPDKAGKPKQGHHATSSVTALVCR